MGGDLRLPASTGWRGRTPDLRSWGYSNRFAHADLRRSDGDIFLLIYDAGRAVYSHPVDDPIYSAHQRLDGQVRGYFPDFQYTAMARLEQYRICLPSSPGECMHYAPSWAAHTSCLRRCPPAGGGCFDRPREIAEACRLFTTLGTITSFVNARGVAAMLAFERSTWNNPYISIDPFDQWVWDVKAWFESSFLMMPQSILLEVMGDPDPWVKSRGAKENFCGRVLFLDGDFTNINFPGFVLTLVLVAGISGLTHATQIMKGAGTLRNILVDAFWSLIRLSRLCYERVQVRTWSTPGTRTQKANNT